MSKVFYGQLGRLKPNKIDDYVKLHADVWPGVIEMMKECNLSNYSTFLYGEMVFAYFEYEGDNYEIDMQKMADDLLTQEWWTHTHPCFVEYAISKDSQFYHDMKQIFYME
ncbi:MAG: L-rhamnose mutarotase [Fastidiosipila sp.]|nr:L-rhamnose mutarotase [Fastidiosipila sp.]